MVSPLLAKAAPSGRQIVEVTPERAGWTHVGFRALRLASGETEAVATGERELCLVVLTGRVDVQVGEQRFDALGTRDSVFDDRAPAALYVPPHHELHISARADCAGIGLHEEFAGAETVFLADVRGWRYPRCFRRSRSIQERPAWSGDS